MKKCFRMAVLAFFTSVMSLGVVSSASGAVVAYWDFSSDSNGVTDVSGNYNTLVNNGVVISNGIAVFNGSHSAFNTANPLNLTGKTKLTVEFFMRTTNTDMRTIAMQGSNSLAAGAFYLDINDPGLSAAGGKVASLFRPASPAASTYYHADYTAVANDGLWHHVAWVYDTALAGDARCKLFLDRVEQSHFTQNSTAIPALLNQPFYIGSDSALSPSSKYVGELDDVRISDTALTNGTFLTARTEALPVIAHWRFNEGAGQADSSGNNRLLTGSGVTFTNGVARFDGSANSLNTASALNLSAYPKLTIECFVRAFSQNIDGGLLFEHGGDANNNASPGGFFGQVDNTGSVTGARYLGGSSWHMDNSATNVSNERQWHHVAWVYDNMIATVDRYRLYVDGVQQPQSSAYTALNSYALLNQTLYIGSRRNNKFKFNGELDDLRVTGAALVPVQFQKTPSTALPEVIAYWPFANSAPLADASGNGHTLTNAGVTFANGAAVFNGAHTAFSTKPWTVNLRPYSALTVEYFVRTTSTNMCLVVEHSGNFNIARGGFASVLNEYARGQLESGFSLARNEYNIDDTPADTVLDGLWHHVALVYDPAQSGDDRVRFYFDRVQQGKRIEGLFVSDADIAFPNDYLFLGSRGDGTTLRFSGELDDVKITGAALPVEAFMQARTSPWGTLIMVF